MVVETDIEEDTAEIDSAETDVATTDVDTTDTSEGKGVYTVGESIPDWVMGDMVPEGSEAAEITPCLLLVQFAVSPKSDAPNGNLITQFPVGAVTSDVCELVDGKFISTVAGVVCKTPPTSPSNQYVSPTLVYLENQLNKQAADEVCERTAKFRGYQSGSYLPSYQVYGMQSTLSNPIPEVDMAEGWLMTFALNFAIPTFINTKMVLVDKAIYCEFVP